MFPSDKCQVETHDTMLIFRDFFFAIRPLLFFIRLTTWSGLTSRYPRLTEMNQ